MMTMNATKGKRPSRQGFWMECVIRPMTRRFSGFLASVLILIAIVTYIGHQLPTFFPHRTTITKEILEEKLQAIGELATYEMTYRGYHIWGDSREFPVIGVEIPGTYNDLKVEYTGTIKVGYDFEGITVDKLDDTRVLITVPKVKVLDNYIEQTAETTHLSLFNRIPENKAIELMEEAKSDELKSAVNQGIYQLAENNAKEMITALLSQFGDFEIEIIFR